MNTTAALQYAATLEQNVLCRALLSLGESHLATPIIARVKQWS